MVMVVVVVVGCERLPQHCVMVVDVEGLPRHRHWRLPQIPNLTSWFCIGSLFHFVPLSLLIDSYLQLNLLHLLLQLVYCYYYYTSFADKQEMKRLTKGKRLKICNHAIIFTSGFCLLFYLSVFLNLNRSLVDYWLADAPCALALFSSICSVMWIVLFFIIEPSI